MVVTRKYHFYAAHRNKHAGEKCGRIHGHTYDIECTFNFRMDANGVSMLFADIDKLIEPIIKQYCHFLLLYENDPLCKILKDANEPFIALPFETSVENLGEHIFFQIKGIESEEYIGYFPIVELSISETKSSKIIIR